MKHAFVLRFAVLWFALSSASVAWSQVDPLTLWTWSDGASCDIRNDGNFSSTVGCCGSPGWRACGYVVNWNKGLSPGCTDPGQNILRTDSYDHTVICNLDSPPIVVPPFNVGSTSATFYVGSDFHVFRGTFNPTVQSHIAGTIGTWATSKAQWPSGAGIPASDTVDFPLAMVIAGDLTTGGGVEELAAYRTVWEAGTLGSSGSFPFTVLPGLGNHDLVSAGTGGAGASSSAQRMWDYIGNILPLYNVDRSATGQLGTDDGQGTHNYSWDWNGVHYIELNTWAGETNQYNTPASAGFTWLTNDLQQNVGSYTRPVVIFQHYDLLSVGNALQDPIYDLKENTIFQTWWTMAQYQAFWNIIHDYNVIGTFSGHVHSWDVERPEHYRGFYGSNGPYGSDTLPNTDSKGNVKIYDVFRSAPLGDGSFFSVRVTPDYLDVASWSTPVVFFPPQPDSTSKMFGGTAACRKKINTRFVDYSDLISFTTNSDGSVTAANNTQFTLPGPLAFGIGTTTNVANRNFVDSCDAYFGKPYITANVTGGALAPGASVSTPVQTSGTYSTSLVQLAPLGFQSALLTNVSSISLSGTNQPPQNLYFFAPVGVTAPFTTSITYEAGSAGKWLSATSIAGIQGATGGFALAFNASILGAVTGSETAKLTITASGGDSVTVPVTVIVSPSLQVSTNDIDFSQATSQTINVTGSHGSTLNFQATVPPGFTVTPSSGTTPATLTIVPSNTQDIGSEGSYQRPLIISTQQPSPVSKVIINVNLTVANVTVAASSPSIPVTVDTAQFTGASPLLHWITGSTHSVSVPSSFSQTNQQYRFASWSDGGNISQTITGPAQGAYRYLASFKLYDHLNIGINPSASGGIVQTNPIASDMYFPDGSSVTLTALDNSSYYFTGFSGALTTQQSPQILTMDGPEQVTANWAPTNGAGHTTISTTPSSIGIQVDHATSWVAPAGFYWDSGQQHTVSINPQQISPTSQLGFIGWNDGNTSSSRVISGIHGGVQNFTATVGTQYLVNVTPSPALSGTITGGGFINSGSSTVLTATPAAGFAFSGFSGDVTSSSNGRSVPVSGPLNISANFTATSAPSVVVAPGNRTPTTVSDGIVLGLTLSNRGTGPAGDLAITGIDGFKDLSGTDAGGSSVLSLVPLSVGTLLPGQSLPTTVTLLWPASSTRMQMTVHYSANSGAYTGSAILSVFR
jgi:Divergent InlB B-repeat domain/Calcineurin-like phosphoesterase